LAYSYDTLELVVEMPLPIHEALVKIINKEVEDADTILRACIPAGVLTYDSHTNLRVVAEQMSFIPDCLHIVQSVTFPNEKHVVVIGEVAFSQPEADLRERLRFAIKAQPEVIMVIMATITELSPYATARPKSSAWQTLCDESSVRSQSSFFSECTVVNSSSNVPPSEIVVHGHKWFSLESVRFQIWVKCGNNPIDLDTTDSTVTLTARGVSIFNTYVG